MRLNLRSVIRNNFNTYKEDRGVVERNITYLHQSVSQHEFDYRLKQVVDSWNLKGYNVFVSHCLKQWVNNNWKLFDTPPGNEKTNTVENFNKEVKAAFTSWKKFHIIDTYILHFQPAKYLYFNSLARWSTRLRIRHTQKSI